MSGKVISEEAKIDAYNMAISYLQTEECVYDNDRPFKDGRLWLAGELEKQIKLPYGRLFSIARELAGALQWYVKEDEAAGLIPEDEAEAALSKARKEGVIE